MSFYSIENNQFYKQRPNKKVLFKAFGATLYPAHAKSPGWIERCITTGLRKGGQHMIYRMVLIFEGYNGLDILKAPGWNTVKQALELGISYNVGITVELGSSLISYLEKKGENPYDKKWDSLFEKVIKKGCEMYGNYSSLFSFTVINEFGPYRKPQAYFDLVFRRLKSTGTLIKHFSNNTILVGSGGLLHLTEKSGGNPPPVTCEWIDDGKTKRPYWEGVYSCPSIDFNMIHIYANEIEKIENDETEWSNLETYHDFSAQYGKPMIVDEFGHKLPLDAPQKVIVEEGKRFLNAVDGALSRLNKEKVPPIIKFWNFNSTSQGFDWWPEFSANKPLFAIMKKMRREYFATHNSGTSLKPKVFQLDTVEKLLDESHTLVEYTCPANKLTQKTVYNKVYEEGVDLDNEKFHGLCASISSKIPYDNYRLKLRMYLLTKNKRHRHKGTKFLLQGWETLRQNDIIPTYDRNEMFVDFTFGDIREFGTTGALTKHYLLCGVKLVLICNKPKKEVKGAFTLTNIRLASK
jgi:hypothetical protein